MTLTTEQANSFREQLTEAMKRDAFRDDEEYFGFVKEVDALFEPARQ